MRWGRIPVQFHAAYRPPSVHCRRSFRNKDPVEDIQVTVSLPPWESVTQVTQVELGGTRTPVSFRRKQHDLNFSVKHLETGALFLLE